MNPTFMENYKPRDCLAANEFWIRYLDFVRHFGELVMCSSSEPYRTIETDVDRRYKDDSTDDFSNVFFSVDEKQKSSGQPEMQHLPLANQNQRKSSIEIVVQESKRTVKLDTVKGEQSAGANIEDTLFTRRNGPDSATEVRKHHMNNKERATKYEYESGGFKDIKNRVSSIKDQHHSGIPLITHTPPSTRGSSTSSLYSYKDNIKSSVSGYSHSSYSRHNSGQSPSGVSNSLYHGASIASNLSGVSNYSTLSSVSDSESTYSTSEIRIKVSGCRSHLERLNINTNPSFLSHERRHSLQTSASQTSIFESRVDYFQSHGSWREIVRHFGKWKRKLCYRTSRLTRFI